MEWCSEGKEEIQREREWKRERQKPLEEEAEEGADKETSFRRWMVSF